MKSTIENHKWDGDCLLDLSTPVPWLVARIDAQPIAPRLVQWEAYWREDGRWQRTEGSANSRADAKVAAEEELKRIRDGVVRWRGRKAYIGSFQIGELQENYTGHWVMLGTESGMSEEMARKVIEYAGGLIRAAREIATTP